MVDNTLDVQIVMEDMANFDYSGMTIDQLPAILIKVMEKVEKFKGKSGEEKKQIVIDVITKIVDDSDLAGASEEYILPLIPSLIDKIVEADGGKLKLNTNLKNKLVKIFNKLKVFFKTNCKCGCKCCKN